METNLSNQNELMDVLKAGRDLVQSAFAHISHGGPTKADAEKWLERVERTLSSPIPQTPRNPTKQVTSAEACGTNECPLCGKTGPHAHPELETKGYIVALAISNEINRNKPMGLHELARICGYHLMEYEHATALTAEQSQVIEGAKLYVSRRCSLAYLENRVNALAVQKRKSDGDKADGK